VLDRLAECRHDLLSPPCDATRVISDQDEDADAVLEHQGQQLLNPRSRVAASIARGGVPERAVEVEDPANRGWITAGRDRRFVDQLVSVASWPSTSLIQAAPVIQPSARGRPSVGLPGL
jgi:hypothetical protein